MSGVPVSVPLERAIGRSSGSSRSSRVLSSATSVDHRLVNPATFSVNPQEINSLNSRPFRENPVPRSVDIQQPGRPFDERADNRAVNGRLVAEESIRRYLLRFQDPLVQHLCNVSASANINSYLDLTDKQDSLTSETPTISNGEVADFDLDFESNDLVSSVNKELFNKVVEIALNKEGTQAQAVQQLLGIISRNRALDIRYSGSFENLGIIRFSAKFVKCNNSALRELKDYFQNQGKNYDFLQLSDLILCDSNDIKDAFADLCAYFLLLNKADNLVRPVSDSDDRRIGKKKQRSLKFFDEVIYDKDLKQLVVERKQRNKRIFEDIDDLYDRLM